MEKGIMTKPWFDRITAPTTRCYQAGYRENIGSLTEGGTWMPPDEENQVTSDEHFQIFKKRGGDEYCYEGNNMNVRYSPIFPKPVVFGEHNKIEPGNF